MDKRELGISNDLFIIYSLLLNMCWIIAGRKYNGRIIRLLGNSYSRFKWFIVIN